MSCPACRGEIETLRERIRQFEEILTGSDLPWDIESLTVSERKVLGILRKRQPNPVAKGDLLTALYFDDPANERTPKIIDVFVCKIRKKLAGQGVHIKTLWGFGFALADGEGPLTNKHTFPRGRTHRWTPEEDDIVRHSAGTIDAARQCGRTPNAVWARAVKIGHRWSGRTRRKLAA